MTGSVSKYKRPDFSSLGQSSKGASTRSYPKASELRKKRQQKTEVKTSEATSSQKVELPPPPPPPAFSDNAFEKNQTSEKKAQTPSSTFRSAQSYKRKGLFKYSLEERRQFRLDAHQRLQEYLMETDNSTQVDKPNLKRIMGKMLRFLGS